MIVPQYAGTQPEIVKPRGDFRLRWSPRHPPSGRYPDPTRSPEQVTVHAHPLTLPLRGSAQFRAEVAALFVERHEHDAILEVTSSDIPGFLDDDILPRAENFATIKLLARQEFDLSLVQSPTLFTHIRAATYQNRRDELLEPISSGALLRPVRPTLQDSARTRARPRSAAHRRTGGQTLDEKGSALRTHGNVLRSIPTFPKWADVRAAIRGNPPMDGLRALTGRNGYLVRNRAAVACLAAIDLMPWPSSRSMSAGGQPRRLLFSMLAHLGDCVVSTATLQLAAEAFPDAEIGIVVASWSAELFRDDPRIAHLHIVDHWCLNRAKIPLRAKLCRYAGTRNVAIREMRRVGYDTAIDLFYNFPSAGPLLHAAGIPRRIGYESGGFRRFLTHPRPWVLADQHVAEYQAALLADVGMLESDLAVSIRKLRPRLLSPLRASPKTVPDSYIVVHMGAGAAVKEWPETSWRELIAVFGDRDLTIVLTGNGSDEVTRCARVANGFEHVINLCGLLDLAQLRAVIGGARLIVCVSSLAAQLSVAEDTPAVVLWAGVANPAHWRPLSDKAVVLHSNPPCLPCYEWRGCPAMTCIRAVTVDRVLDATLALLADPETTSTRPRVTGKRSTPRRRLSRRQSSAASGA